jgi:hypothetical protein
LYGSKISLKKSKLIGIGIGIAVVIILGMLWVIGNDVEKTSSPSGNNNSSLTVSPPPPVGKTYHLNFSESIGIKAQP